jgi:hypothetical protein
MQDTSANARSPFSEAGFRALAAAELSRDRLGVRSDELSPATSISTRSWQPGAGVAHPLPRRRSRPRRAARVDGPSPSARTASAPRRAVAFPAAKCSQAMPIRSPRPARGRGGVRLDRRFVEPLGHLDTYRTGTALGYFRRRPSRRLRPRSIRARWPMLSKCPWRSHGRAEPSHARSALARPTPVLRHAP